MLFVVRLHPDAKPMLLICGIWPTSQRKKNGSWHVKRLRRFKSADMGEAVNWMTNCSCSVIARPDAKIHTIFEGTSEIQQLVIARAISGMRVE